MGRRRKRWRGEKEGDEERGLMELGREGGGRGEEEDGGEAGGVEGGRGGGGGGGGGC